MIVKETEYNNALASIMDPNEYLKYIRIPAEEPIYEINLNTRTIEAPSFLGAYKEHNAEILWFKVDRFFDNIDLYGRQNSYDGPDSLKRTGNCWIQYRNAKKEEFYYAAPMLIYVEEFGADKILIPWVISQDVAGAAGTVEFSFQFFALSEGADGDSGRHLRYIVNTQPAKSKVLSGMWVDPEDALGKEEKEPLVTKLQELEAAYAKLSSDYNLFWIDIT